MKLALAIAAAASTLCSPAFAQSYVIGALGMGRTDISCDNASSCDRDDVAGKFSVGYTWENGLAVEGGYFNFGKASKSEGRAYLETTSAGPYIAGAWHFRIARRTGMSLRAGGSYIETKVGNGSSDESNSNWAPYAGVALNYAIQKNVRTELAGDYSRASFRDNTANLIALTLGVKVSFF